MILIPSRSQWRKWTLPSKASYVGCAVGVVALVAAILLALWSNYVVANAGQPQLAVTYTAKPYLRYQLYEQDGMEFSYEIRITNSGRNPATRLSYGKRTQSLVVDDKIIARSEAGAGERPLPRQLVSGGHYCQIFKMTNTNMTAKQIANCVAKYETEDLAIILEIEIHYVDQITGREFSLAERNKIHKGRVEIL
jgi:hypothetical protein